MLFLRAAVLGRGACYRHFHRMPHLGRVDGMRAHHALLPPGRHVPARPGIVVVAEQAPRRSRAQHGAQREDADGRVEARRAPPACAGGVIEHQILEALRHGFVCGRTEPCANGIAVGRPHANPGGVLRMLVKPGIDLVALARTQFVIEPGRQLVVHGIVVGGRVHDQTTRRRLRVAGVEGTWPSSKARKAARPRDTRDMTVPMGMRITSAHSA